MKTRLFSLLLLFISLFSYSQVNLDYQKPPKEILDLVDVEPAPNVMFNSDRSIMITLQRDAFKSISDLSKKELRLGGLRIDPQLNIGSRVTYYHTIKIKDLTNKNAGLESISGLPSNPRLTNFSFSPDESKLAFTHTSNKGVELWFIDLSSKQAKKLTAGILNANTSGVLRWFENSEELLIKVLPADRFMLINSDVAVPTGPTISTSDGKKAQNRTYQDLLKNPNDEFNFEQLVSSEIYKIDVDGNQEKWLDKSMYTSIRFSPDGNYVLVTELAKPFSYLVTYGRFPATTSIYDKDGKMVKLIYKKPLIEDIPKGFGATVKGPRSFTWRADKPATLVYVKALDDGDPAKIVKYRDEVFQLAAPFEDMPTRLVRTVNRYSGIQWAGDRLAIASDSWFKTRNTKKYRFDPSDNAEPVTIISDRNSQDRYSNPGSFVMRRNEFGSYVIDMDKGNNAYLIGAGYTENGQFPFLDKINLDTQKKTRLYTSSMDGSYESINDYNPKTNELFVRIESKNEFPNYFVRSLKKDRLTRITNFPNPFKSIQNIHKEVITYKRDDGLELSGTLYLPTDYEANLKKKWPMILWAYPVEYKDKASASQSTANPNRFTYPNYGSPIYWVTQGYVVLNNAAFPIIGEGDNEPNDSFRSQLVANGKAAIDAVDALGYIDRKKVAVGGHSYGAFMVANLLSHSDHYAAGIARSGAYNRTLTPFGFQREERSYWEAPEVYYTMSPFMHADKMKTPLLLIHGEADNNSGTYPMQSERYFNALKGLGAVVRLVMLPKESHGYAAKESVLHMIWEQHMWLEKHVKNK